MVKSKLVLVVVFVLLVTYASGFAPLSNSARGQASGKMKPADVDTARIVNADKEPGNWMTYGRTYSEQRFSPLKEINDQNAKRLGLAWYYDLDTNRGQEATPIVVDGVMYFTTAWDKVVALNAATGAELWTYDPKVPPEWAINLCCDVVNRGVAVWKGKVFFGTLDGRLVALAAATGKLVWQTLTIDPKLRYSITGAPRVVKGLVMIGNGGAEMDVRGYVSAYHADTGKLAWRFYTIPGNPAENAKSAAMRMAAKTWHGQWSKGRGGTVWDSIVYDPELDLLYFGVGNGTPWNRRIRSPGGGDNLFLASIVALKPETGKFVWYYQETPGEMWDYDSCEQITLADIKINGAIRKVLFHAPKNGFFYVIDRATGKLISAKPITAVNWASGINMKTGQPIETPIARYEGENPPPVAPGPLGAHNWQPMSYDPLTGLVYIPVQDAGFEYKSPKNFEEKKLATNYGLDVVAAGMPQDPNIKKAIMASVTGRLLAWNPVKQKSAWQIQRPGPWNGGVLSTAGNLVFEGTAGGNFEAYRADTGEKLWSFPSQTGVMAGPVTYEVDGRQYVAALAGWGGVFPLATGELSFKSGVVRNISRMLVFELDGKANLPPMPDFPKRKLNPPATTADAATIANGEQLYQRYCATCHGDVAVSGGVLPDLRYSETLKNDQWYAITMGGALKSLGMVSFAKELTRKDLTAIREYVIMRANQSKAQENQGTKTAPDSKSN